MDVWLRVVARSYRIYDEDFVGIILINLLFMKIFQWE